MGFWKAIGKAASVAIDKAPAVMSELQVEGAKKRSEVLKQEEKRLSKAEKNIDSLNREISGKYYTETKQYVNGIKIGKV